MLLSERRTPPFDDPDWIYELKFDGWRLLAGVHEGGVHLMTRKGADATRWFPEICAGLATLPGGPHVLDGEVCALDGAGRADFNLLQERVRRRSWYDGAGPVVYCAFDLLVSNGGALIRTPIEWRKVKLEELLTPRPPSVMMVRHFDAQRARQLLQEAQSSGLEGLAAKRLGSLYRPGERSPDWVKVLAAKPQSCAAPAKRPPA
jgi:bifunctional non-homologous end joining protein LigD